jgi:hypothetical protein
MLMQVKVQSMSIGKDRIHLPGKGSGLGKTCQDSGDQEDCQFHSERILDLMPSFRQGRWPGFCEFILKHSAGTLQSHICFGEDALGN